MTDKRYTTIRTNTIKCDIQKLMNELKDNNIKFDRVPWYKDALIIKNVSEKELQKLDIYDKGFFYMQSLSSMVPPIVLNPIPGERILDLTAAPGSKTTQIAALMNNEGFVLANEIDKIRFERLKYNIEKQGATIVKLVNGRGEKIGEEYPEEFDKVLLDAPCSGEGRFMVNKVATYRDWSKKTVNDLAKLQKKLITSASKALKKNGILVYSTCTLNEDENEKVLEWAINNLGLKLIDIDIKVDNTQKANNIDYDKTISKAIRIIPSKKTEGFFIAKLKKI